MEKIYTAKFCSSGLQAHIKTGQICPRGLRDICLPDSGGRKCPYGLEKANPIYSMCVVRLETEEPANKEQFSSDIYDDIEVPKTKGSLPLKYKKIKLKENKFDKLL